MAVFGYSELTLGYVVVLSLADTVLVLALILLFLRSHGERPGALFLGGRPIGREVLAGLPLIFGALGLALFAIVTVRWLAPWLEPAEPNPLQALIDTRQAALLFALVVVTAGGFREELQRAFVLRRFDHGLGGPVVGVVVGSLAFGAGHLLQGADAAITTVLLGVFWAITYLRRGSVVAPIVSHSGFNLLQLVQMVVGLS
jgi:membrane protease YdiL (CAAX protease family)